MMCDASQLWRHQAKKYTICDCGVFIFVSNGIIIREIYEEMRQLHSRKNGTFIPDTVQIKTENSSNSEQFSYVTLSFTEYFADNRLNVCAVFKE